MGDRPPRPTRRITVVVLAALACLSPLPAVSQVPHDDVDVMAIARATTGPEWVPWIHQDSGRPYRLLDPDLTVAIDPSTVDRVGRQPLVAGLTAFNDVPGSAVEVTVTVDPTTADVQVREVPCRRLEDKQGRAHPHVRHVGARAAWVDTAHIDVCPRLRDRPAHYARHLMAHELAHLLGFGHLCDAPHCWPLRRRPDPCEFMRPSVHPCQDLGVVRAALATLYPAGDPSPGDAAPCPTRPRRTRSGAPCSTTTGPVEECPCLLMPRRWSTS